jgi:hypothetical protein
MSTPRSNILICWKEYGRQRGKFVVREIYDPNNNVTCWVCHATNNLTWVSDLAYFYWTLTLTHLTIIITWSITSGPKLQYDFLGRYWIPTVSFVAESRLSSAAAIPRLSPSILSNTQSFRSKPGSLYKPHTDSIEDTPRQGSISRVQQSVASGTLLPD